MKKEKSGAAVALVKSPDGRGFDVADAAEVKLPDSGDLGLSEAVRGQAVAFGIDEHADLDLLANLAAEQMGQAQKHAFKAGLALLCLKARCQHGQFLALLEEREFPQQRASEVMRMAVYLSRQTPDEMSRLMLMPKSKLMLLAAADQEVIDLVVETGVKVEALSVQALQDKLREARAQLADQAVLLETAQAEAKAAKKASKKDRDSEVPVAIFDIRAEAVAQVERSRLAVEEVQALGRDLINLRGVEGVYQWVDPTARLAISGLIALQVQIDGVLKQFKDAFDLEDIKPTPMSYLVPVEVEEAAKRFADLLALHQHEKALRDWERQQERPRGKGRPAAKPEAPKTRAE